MLTYLFPSTTLLGIWETTQPGKRKLLLENNSLRPCSGSIPDNTPCRRTCLLVIDYFCIFERILFFRLKSLIHRPPKWTSFLFSGGIFFIWKSWFICFCLSGWNSIFRCSRWGLLSEPEMEILERTVLRNWMQQWLQWLKWYTTVAENPYTRLLTLLDYL